MRNVVLGGNILHPVRQPRSFCAWWVMTLAVPEVFCP